MAAADFFSAGSPPTQPPHNPSFLAPPGQPPRASSLPGYGHPPPPPPQQQPYTPPGQNAPPRFGPPPSYHSTPASPSKPPFLSPESPYQRHSFSNLQRPDPASWNQPPPSRPYPPQNYPRPPPPPPPPPPLGRHRPHHSDSGPRPPMYHQPNSSYASLSGYSTDPEPHRRRRRNHHHSDKQPRDNPRSRSSNTDSLLGAAGGGLIGDLIWPGLGTVGGALAGWIGGREYGAHRKRRESTLESEQREWEMKWGHRGHRSSSRRRSGEGH